MTVVTSWCSTGSQKPHGYCPLCIKLKISATDKPKVLPHSHKWEHPGHCPIHGSFGPRSPSIPQIASQSVRPFLHLGSQLCPTDRHTYTRDMRTHRLSHICNNKPYLGTAWTQCGLIITGGQYNLTRGCNGPRMNRANACSQKLFRLNTSQHDMHPCSTKTACTMHRKHVTSFFVCSIRR